MIMVKNESAVLFVIDTSGSMCVTTAVDGRLTLRGDRTKDMRRLLEEGVKETFHFFLPLLCNSSRSGESGANDEFFF